MNNKLIKFNLSKRKEKDIPEVKTGDVVRVHRKIREGNKERTQIFEGIVIAVKGKQSSSPMITVRKISSGVGVELVLPMYSPNIAEIELVKRAKIRRSKLYYIRHKTVKAMRLKYKDVTDFLKKEEKNESEIKNVREKTVAIGNEKKDKNNASSSDKTKDSSKTKASADKE